MKKMRYTGDEILQSVAGELPVRHPLKAEIWAAIDACLSGDGAPWRALAAALRRAGVVRWLAEIESEADARDDWPW